MITAAKSALVELSLIFALVVVVVCITVLAALQVAVPSQLGSLALFLGGGGAGVAVPGLISKVVSALAAAPPVEVPASSAVVIPGGPAPAPPG